MSTPTPLDKLPAAEREAASWLINAGADDTKGRISKMTGTETDLRVLKAALATEKSRPTARSSRIKPIEAAIRKFEPQGKLALIEKEAPAPDWSRARIMLEGIKLATRLSIAGQICLGLELLSLKKQLGFLGSGRRANKTDNLSTLNRSWDQWVKSELGVSYKTADRLIEMAEAAKLRVKKLGGADLVIGLLDTPPAKLTDEKRRVLETLVSKATDGATQAELLAELKLVKAPKVLEGGDTSAHKKAKTPPTGEQLSFAFFKPVATNLMQVRSNPQYDRYLHTLPVEGEAETDLSLTVLERELEGMLADVREAKKAAAAAKKATANATATAA